MSNWTGTDPAKWAQQAIRKVKAAPQIIVDEMANTMTQYVTVGGLTPVDTGNLSRSVTISFSPIKADPEGYHAPQRQNFDYVARRMPPDSTAYIGYRARYAWRVNYGFVGQDSLGRTYNQAGRAFLEGYVSQWPQVVNRAIARLNSGSWIKL